LIRSIAKRLGVSALGDSELVKISYQSTEPQTCAGIVNAVVESYFAVRGQDVAESSAEVIALLEQEQQKHAAEVARLQEQVRRAAEKVPGGTAAGTAQASAAQPSVELQTRLTALKVEQETLKAQIAALEAVATAGVDVPPAPIAAAVETHPAVIRQNGLVLARHKKLAEIANKSVLGTSDPLYRQELVGYYQEQQAVTQLKARLWQRVKATEETTLRKKQADDLVLKRTKLQENLLLVRMLDEAHQQRVAEIKQSRAEVVDFKRKQTELAQAEQVLDRITDRIVTVRTERRAPARVSLVRPAEVPAEPTKLVPLEKMSAAALLAFCLPLGVAVCREHRNRRVSDSRQLLTAANLNVIAELPCLPAAQNGGDAPSPKLAERELGIFEESVDGLRTYLMLSEPSRNMKVLAVTSSVSNEGKTSLATQLALSIAHASGEPTLLIDGDMRCPDIHEIFDVPQTSGLAEVLGYECGLEDALVTSWDKRLHLLSAGQLKVSPHKLLGNNEFEALLRELRSSYGHIIIDTPPVLAASETLVMAKAADAFLMCVMHDKSRVDQVTATHRRLQTAGAYSAGVVLNAVPSKRYSQRYGNYAYGYGAKQA